MATQLPSTPVNEFMASQIIRDANDKMYRAQGQSERIAQAGGLKAKMQSVDAAVKTAAGSMADATSKFIASGAGAITNMKLAKEGVKGMSPREALDKANTDYAARKEREERIKATQMTNLANNGGMNQVITNSADAMSNAVGGANEMNVAKIADKMADAHGDIFKNLEASAKKGREMAQKGVDDANEFQKTASDRVQQTLMNLANRI